MVQIGLGSIYIHNHLLRKPRERRGKKRKPLFFLSFSVYSKQSTANLYLYSGPSFFLHSDTHTVHKQNNDCEK